MIVTILCIAVLIIGIFLVAVFDDYFPCLLIGAIAVATGLLSVICCFVFIADAQINKDIVYQNKLYEKQVLEYRIENKDKNIVGNELLYNDIVEFNNDLRFVKTYANNPWTNWLFNEDVATIDYIEIDKKE